MAVQQEAHLGQLAKQLVCPICLHLMKKASNLSCNHFFCTGCIQEAMKSCSACPVCKVPTTRREVRQAPHMDDMVAVYRKMEESTGVNICITQSESKMKNTSSPEESPLTGQANKQSSLGGASKTVSAMRPIGKPLTPGSWSLRGCPPAVLPMDGRTTAPNNSTRLEAPKGTKSPFFWLREKDPEAEEDGDSQAQHSASPVGKASPKVTFSDLEDDGDDSGGYPSDDESADDGESEVDSSERRETRCILSDSDNDDVREPETERKLPASPRRRVNRNLSNLWSDPGKADAGKMEAQVEKVEFSRDELKSPARKSTTMAAKANSVNSNQMKNDPKKTPRRNSEPEFGVRTPNLGKRTKQIKAKESSPADDATCNDQKLGKRVREAEFREDGKICVMELEDNKKVKETLSAGKGHVCGFCGLSGNSKVAGPMMKVQNGGGKVVKCDAIANKKKQQTNGEYVHENCLEWAPDVYFDDERVKNLKSELNRASRIKCSACSAKGAALGCCIAKCRRSYHYACAKMLKDCVWDEEKFVILCPEHGPAGFPHGNQKETQVLTVQMEEEDPLPFKEELGAAATIPENPKRPLEWTYEGSAEWTLCCSGLDSRKKEEVAKFADLTGAKVVKQWSPAVTHLIAGEDSEGRARRTLKYICAILKGQWIVSMRWMNECSETLEYKDEDSFAIETDIHDMAGGPSRGREMAAKKWNGLFHGIHVYFLGSYESPSRADLVSVLTVGGGMVIYLRPQAVKGPVSNSKTYIVYNDVEPAGNLSAAEVDKVMDSRVKDALNLANECGAEAIPHTWLLDSAAKCQLLPTSI